MLIILKDGDSCGLSWSYVLGIPVRQWRVDDNGSWLRVLVLVPQCRNGMCCCEVEIACEEEDLWRVIGSERGFSTKPFDEEELPKVDAGGSLFGGLGHVELERRIDTDLYYVWDDGAGSHMRRARRLYRIYEDLIKKHEKEAKRIWDAAASKVYAQDLKYAREHDYDVSLIKKASNDVGYGWFPVNTMPVAPA